MIVGGLSFECVFPLLTDFWLMRANFIVFGYCRLSVFCFSVSTNVIQWKNICIRLWKHMGQKLSLSPVISIFDEKLLAMFPVFFFILGLLDGLLNCYHMLSLCTAVIDLMWVCCFPDSVCGECVWERGKETNTQWQRERNVNVCRVNQLGSFSK